tara:strand:- start:314 stop:649 length:336 start_codon:yes stop_codon:yes gene_type:complete
MHTIPYWIGICICIAGIIVGSLAKRRSKTAALITITGWSLMLIRNGICLTIFYIDLPWAFANLSSLLFSLTGGICIFLGIYLTLKRVSSQGTFFSLKYNGLDLDPDTERSS